MKAPPKGVNKFKVVKENEEYRFFYDNESIKTLVETMAKFAMDKGLSFAWYNAVEACGSIPNGFDMLLALIGKMAADPNITFTWYNAAQVSQLIRKFREQAL